MTRDEAVKLVGVLRRTAISFFESRTDDALIRALDAEDALIAALSAPAAGEDAELVDNLLQVVARGDLTTEEEKERDALRAALLSRLRAVPQGWKLVPLEATAEMMKAVPDYPTVVNYWDCYRILVAAAPAPEKDQPK